MGLPLKVGIDDAGGQSGQKYVRSEISASDGDVFIREGGYSRKLNLKYFPDHIRVGCTKITREAIEHIYQYAKENP